MQIVGRECSTCRERLESEAGAIGCERCEVAFHTACLGAAAPTTYRDATTKKPKGAPLLCQTCNDDLLALKRKPTPSVMRSAWTPRLAGSSTKSDVYGAHASRAAC
jgi:hypothetical protein